MPTPYTPIDCDFHDELEVAATRAQPVDLVIRGDDGKDVHVRTIITDLGHGEEDGVRGEYMTLKNGQRVRFDRIVSIDGKRRPGA